jgi:hypothetical protein
MISGSGKNSLLSTGFEAASSSMSYAMAAASGIGPEQPNMARAPAPIPVFNISLRFIYVQVYPIARKTHSFQVRDINKGTKILKSNNDI